MLKLLVFVSFPPILSSYLLHFKSQRDFPIADSTERAKAAVGGEKEGNQLPLSFMHHC